MISFYRSAPRTVMHRALSPYHQTQGSATATLPAKSWLAFCCLGGLNAAVQVIALRAFIIWLFHL